MEMYRGEAGCGSGCIYFRLDTYRRTYIGYIAHTWCLSNVGEGHSSEVPLNVSPKEE